MRAWIKPYFIRETEPKMFLSPWRMSLAESQDAYFVCYFILSTFCCVLGRVAPRILKHSTRIMVCLGKGKYKHLNFSFLFFHLLVAHLLWYLVEWLWHLRRSLQYHRFPSKVIFWLLISERFWIMPCVRMKLWFFWRVFCSMASLGRCTGAVTRK